MIEILDCTLRDGGYCNGWRFGASNIEYTIKKLDEANVDYIEIGFISQKKEESADNTIYWDRNELKKITSICKGKKAVAMCNYGEVDFLQLPCAEETGLYGIRLAFHKDDYKEALSEISLIEEKGYHIFLQPMITFMYSEKELIEIVDIANSSDVYALYIVDSFGIATKKDVKRVFDIYDLHLKDGIRIGFHSHNNMQLAFSNAISLLEKNVGRTIVIDCSIMGMGRGAGNLNTELFFHYLNNEWGENYNVKPLLQVIDKVIAKFYAVNMWGYSLPQYLSAIHRCHPNYAIFLTSKHTLNVSQMDNILDSIPKDNKNNYDEKVIESLYMNSQYKFINDVCSLEYISDRIKGKKILLIGPAPSTKKFDFKPYCNKDEWCIFSINYINPFCVTDFIFISNQKRLEEIKEQETCCADYIVTSNLSVLEEKRYHIVDYQLLCCSNAWIIDNSFLMLLKLLINLGVSEVYACGLDGYSFNIEDNYLDNEMILEFDFKNGIRLNQLISEEICKLADKINIVWLTDSLYSS